MLPVEPPTHSGSEIDTRRLCILRLGLGFLQGVAAWLLLELVPSAWMISDGSSAEQWWAVRHPTVFAICVLIISFVPTIALVEIGRMRRQRLFIYLGAVMGLLAALVAYDIWRDPLEPFGSASQPRVWPSAGLVISAGLGLFIANQLLEHRDRGHRLFASYATHFEDGWMRGFQLVVSLIFTLLVWGVLELGRALFGLIQVEWFGRMIEHNWFRCPVLALAFAAAVHITDVRPVLLRGMRNLGLTLLSWLLPLIVVLGCGFLLALLSTGLGPLWRTRLAASILLWATAVTLVLVNAAYKDGDADNAPVLPIRWTGRAAGPMMLTFALLAAYAIGLRVSQHGWTPERVRAAAVAIMALVYGGGYSFAALARGAWLKTLEKTNVSAGLIILAILASLLSPLADPARMAVNSQLDRLHEGKVAPDRFDYQFLRFRAGRYGTDALARLTMDANSAIRTRADLARAATERNYGFRDQVDPSLTEAAFSHASVYPKGSTLPSDFTASHRLGDSYETPCLSNGSACDIIFLGRDRSTPMLLVYDRSNSAYASGRDGQRVSAPVFSRDEGGHWRWIGRINNLDCPGVMDALRHGQSASIRPIFDDLLAGGVRLEFVQANPGAGNCPKIPAPGPTNKPGPAIDTVAPVQMGPAFGNPGG